jgi:hypothetical protein
MGVGKDSHFREILLDINLMSSRFTHVCQQSHHCLQTSPEQQQLRVALSNNCLGSVVAITNASGQLYDLPGIPFPSTPEGFEVS